jgi:hypothetical protein
MEQNGHARPDKQPRSDFAKPTEATPEAIKKRIKDSFVKGPLESGELKASVDVNSTTFYKYLGELVKAEELLREGSGRRVFYALPHQKAELFKSVADRRPSELGKHVQKNTAVFLDELLRGDYLIIDPESPGQWGKIQDKHKMLYQAVLRLHLGTYPMIPLMDEAMRKEGRTGDGISPWRLYRYWIEVMDYLEGR